LEALVNAIPEPTIHLVDDDDAVRDSLRILLESYALTVHDYDSAEDFLRCFDRREFGCLILDLHLPIVGGLDLIRIMRDREISMPVVFITGRGDREIRERALEEGAVAFLEKPVQEEALMAAVRDALSGDVGERPLRPAPRVKVSQGLREPSPS
jgi:two-component system response regulator FixJ